MKRYDLNLLTALDALLREQSVSGAATKLGIGQPAMSAALARLRVLLDDPILVRSGAGMSATPRGVELTEPLRETLARLTALIEPGSAFDPATSQRKFRISGGDYVGMTLLPGLIARLVDSGPGINIRFRYLEKDAALKALDDDALDLALCVNDDLPARYASAVLFTESFIGAARKDHPILIGTVDVRRFVSCDHLLVTERGDERGWIDKILEKEGLTRRVAVTVPSAALVADILSKTDLIATIPARAARHIAQNGSVALFEPPVAGSTWDMRMVWPSRTSRDPGLSWLRSEIRAVADSLSYR